MPPTPDITVLLVDADNTDTVGQGKKIAWKNDTTDKTISVNLPACLAGNPTGTGPLAPGATSQTYNIPPGQAKKGYLYTFNVGPALDTRHGTINVN